MTDNTGAWVGVAGFVFAVVCALAGLFYKLGRADSKIDTHTEELRSLRANYVLGVSDLNKKMDVFMEKLDDLCSRTATIEERTKNLR